jgi:hypothetical protein
MSVAAHWAVREFEMFLRTLSLSFPLLAGVGFAAVVVAWHMSYRWYVTLLIAVGAYCISFVIPSLLLYRPKK